MVWNCVEYCRAWTKDRPYWKYSDLVKSEGNQWKNTNSILDATYNLNIAPTNHDGGKSTSMPDGTKVKKYMFSIENLAWRGTGEQSNLPASEKGLNLLTFVLYLVKSLSFLVLNQTLSRRTSLMSQ